MTTLTTKELSLRTWKDFQKLFDKPGEWGVCQCIHYQRAGPLPLSERRGMSPRQRAARNRRDKKELLSKGRAHGILVYSGEEPVGWCQYGLSHEAPRIDRMRRYQALPFQAAQENLWRISCFCVDRKHRGGGVAEVALESALESIRKKGGGTVEAFPMSSKGGVDAWFGTVSMFKKQGFDVVAPFGRSNVLMRKTI